MTTQRPALPHDGRRHWLGAAAALSTLALAPRAARAQGALDLDVPYVTTPDNVVMAMLEMGKVRTGDFLIDLGSGDGRIVITAALQHGVRGRGIEIDPALVAESKSNARKAGVADQVEFVERDLFLTDFSAADVITMYLLPDVNIKLRPKLLALRPGVRLVSHDWTMGDWQPEQSQEIAAPQKRLGLRKVALLMAWTVPANVGGRHRVVSGIASPANVEWQIDQRYQIVAGGVIRIGADEYRLAAQRIDGGQVSLQGQTRAGATLRLSTTMARQADTIEWRLQPANQPELIVRTQRIPEPDKPDDNPVPGPG